MNRIDKLVLDWFERHGPPAGERLPPERTLAVTLGLSRAALRTGLAALEARGVLLRQVGRGTFVQADPGATVGPGRRDEQAVVDASPRQVLTARLALEPTLARIAAREANGAARAALTAAEAAVVAADDWATYDAADDVFHRVIAEASGNPVLLRLFDETMVASRAVAWEALRPREEVTAPRRDQARQDHVAISAAVLARDAHAAGEAMQRHLVVEYSGLVSVLV